ncbi:MAG: DUF5696 domain-containing protein [Anaerolineales bacterium]|nr:DUF5696 domain-containing protein [Anaerolineales bacterium]MDW8276587.1 DUF5696 domain-containing protein [Anaerolineales bacterium]
MRHLTRFFLTLYLLLTIELFPSLRADASPARPQEIPPSYQRVAQNETFELYVDTSTLAFKLLDKRNGYLWHSGIDELQQGDRLNKSWRAFAQSGVSIEYLDEKAVNKRISIVNAEHTLQVTPIEAGVEAEIKFEEVGISLQVRLRLEAEGVRVEIPSESIRQENPAFKLGLVYLYPFLGATRGGSTPGYMFLPDGTGCLIRFADSTKAKNMFYGRYYGADLGMLAVMPYDPQINRPYPISFPVFGMVHGEKGNAFLAVVEDGAAYGEIQAHPAGILTNFNFLYNAFIYNESYFQATNRSGAGVTTIQKQTNDFDVVVHYRFLQGEAADYVGMARSYQRYLIEKGVLRKALDPNPNIGIRLEFLGGDKEKVLFWWRFVPMTTVRQMQTLLDDLHIPNAEVIYFGWQPLGASSMPPLALKLERGLGSLEELRSVVQNIAANGGRFSLYLDPQAALRRERGYSARNDLAMAITRVNLEGYNRYYNYYFTLEAFQRRYSALTESLASQLDAGLALDGIGFTLYSDFREDAPLNRQQAIHAYQDALGKSPLRLGFYRPNDYLWSLTSAYYDMPLGDNGYIYTSEAVPFLPIVLSGYVPYYGAALNFSPNLEEDILRHVDYGMYPSYFLTYEPTAKMLDTRSSWIYTSSYEQWEEQVRQTYTRMNALLAPVRGQEIIARQKLREGVFVTTYANGKQILVNYTDRPVNYNGMTVPARDAALLESAP